MRRLTGRVLTAVASLGLVLLLVAASPWEQPRVPAIAPIAGVGGTSAQHCGTCHQEIYQEWRASTHAWAWKDAQFQGELYKDPEVGWLCLNCHTPMVDQQAETVVESGVTRSPERVANPTFDAQLRQDGVGCLSCHWRQGGIAAAHQDVQAPHPVVYDPGLKTSETCTTCHQAKARLEDALVCHFNTGEEWAEADSGKACQDCHMPEVHRASAPGAPVRRGGRHTWFGSGVAKGPIDPEVRALWDAWKPGYDLDVSVPAQAQPGQQVTVSATIAHARAGHMVPTGDPERHLWVELEVWSGKTLLEQSRHRIGQKWQWSPVAKQLSDNRLKPGETRTYPVSFEMPSGPVSVKARVRHVRLTDDNWRYHMDLFEADGKHALLESLRALPRSAVRAQAQGVIAPQ